MPTLNLLPLDVAQGAVTQMPAVTGIYWTDTGYAECRAHLVNLSWRPGDLAEPAVKAGVILTGPVDCDACREARP